MKYSKNPIKTFSIGFYEKYYNEADEARKISDRIGTNHYELYIDKITALETVKKIPYYYTQPFADASELATIVLNEFAKKNNITNVLTGDGADQLFCGCTIYDTIFKVQRTHTILNPLNIYVKPELIKNNRKLIYLFSNSDKEYQDQCDIIYYESLLKGLLKYDENNRLKSEFKIESNNWQQRRLFFDFDTFCCERVLTKMGVAAKKNDIEIFTPFLYKDIIEYSLRIPHKYKYYKKNKKFILKDILFKYIPQEFINTKKRGFAIPTQKWLQTYLYEDLKRLSNQKFIDKQNLFNSNYIEKIIKNIDDRKYTAIIWDFYIFQLWYETYML